MGQSMESLIHHFKLVTEGFQVPPGRPTWASRTRAASWAATWSPPAGPGRGGCTCGTPDSSTCRRCRRWRRAMIADVVAGARLHRSGHGRGGPLGRVAQRPGGAGQRPDDDRAALGSRPIQPRYRPTPPPCRTPPGRRRHPPQWETRLVRVSFAGWHGPVGPSSAGVRGRGNSIAGRGAGWCPGRDPGDQEEHDDGCVHVHPLDLPRGHDAPWHCSTSASWRTSTPVRPASPSGCCTTPASSTRSAASMPATPRPTPSRWSGSAASRSSPPSSRSRSAA